MLTFNLDGLVTDVQSFVSQCKRVDLQPMSMDASVALVVACLDEDFPCFLGFSIFGQVLLRTCILGTVSNSLPSKNSEAKFLLEAFILSWFTHVSTRFLQEQGLGG